MAYSTQRAVSDGTMVYLDLAIGYQSRSDIKVFMNDLPAAPGSWAWVGTTDKRISFTPAVPNGVEVLVQRTTRLDRIINLFTLGAKFNNSTMDMNFQQVLFLTQEAVEGSALSDIYNDVDFHGYKIKNVGPAVDDTDVITYGQVKSFGTGAYAAQLAAEAARDLAAKWASQLVGTVDGTSFSALRYAQDAAASATAASGSAGAASTSAGAAATSAGASQLSRLASEAARDAAVVAQGFAEGAAAPATALYDRLDDVETQADLAVTKANTATSTANAAATTAAGREPPITAGTAAQYWRGDKTWQALNKAAVGLGSVDNTSDASKPISTATQNALNGKPGGDNCSVVGFVSGWAPPYVRRASDSAVMPLLTQSNIGSWQVSEGYHQFNVPLRVQGLYSKPGLNGAWGGSVINIEWNGSSAYLFVDTTALGYINLTSDERVKKDITVASGDRAAFTAIQPIVYDYTQVGIFKPSGRRQFGFSAQNLSAVFPYAIDGSVTAVNADGTPKPAMVSDRPILALTVLEVQALIKEVAAMRAEVQDLRAQLNKE